MEESEVHILAWELVDLATHLRQERLFTISEQENLHQLNNKVCVKLALMFRCIYIVCPELYNCFNCFHFLVGCCYVN